jgi:hypothetical protein
MKIPRWWYLSGDDERLVQWVGRHPDDPDAIRAAARRLGQLERISPGGPLKAAILLAGLTLGVTLVGLYDDISRGGTEFGIAVALVFGLHGLFAAKRMETAKFRLKQVLTNARHDVT